MFHSKDRSDRFRSNRAALAEEGPAGRLVGLDAQPLSADGGPHLLARIAKAAQQAIREARDPADVPLPHLYRGREFARKRRAA